MDVEISISALLIIVGAIVVKDIDNTEPMKSVSARNYKTVVL